MILIHIVILLTICVLTQCQHQHQPHTSTLHRQHGHKHFHVKQTSMHTPTPSSAAKISVVTTAARRKRNSPTFVAATVNKKQSPTGFAKRSKDKKRTIAFQNNPERDMQVEDNDASDKADGAEPSTTSPSTMIDVGQYPTGFATWSKGKRRVLGSRTSSLRDSDTDVENRNSERDDESEFLLGEGGLAKILAVGLLMGADLL